MFLPSGLSMFIQYFQVKKELDSKNKEVKSRWNNCGFNSPEIAI